MENRPVSDAPPFHGAEQRRHARAPLATRVEILYSSKQNLVDAICRDISIGGMFVESPAPPALDSRIEFELVLPTEPPKPVRGAGRVVWRRPPERAGAAKPGFGVEFDALDAQFRKLVYRVVDRHIQRGGTPYGLERGDGEAPQR
jgi:uncharacterized protein (TIGR02266 family)